MSTEHPTINPIVNIKFDNTFQHLNVPNQRQHVHKPTCKHGKSRSFKISRSSSITYLKEDCHECKLTITKNELSSHDCQPQLPNNNNLEN